MSDEWLISAVAEDGRPVMDATRMTSRVPVLLSVNSVDEVPPGCIKIRPSMGPTRVISDVASTSMSTDASDTTPLRVTLNAWTYMPTAPSSAVVSTSHVPLSPAGMVMSIVEVMMVFRPSVLLIWRLKVRASLPLFCKRMV